MYLRVNTPVDAVFQAIRQVELTGTKASPRGQATREVTNATIIVDKPWRIPFDLPGRELRPAIGAAEALQLVGQTSAPEVLIERVKAFGKFTDGGVFHGAYGPRIHNRLSPLVEMLSLDADTRQAVLTIYDARQDLGAEVRDVPCTLSIQFMIRDGALCARTSMRSNDLWLGLPYDLIQFAALQGAVAKALSLPMGWYAHTVGSMHIYEHDLDKAAEVREPVHFNFDAYTPLWSGESIGEISSMARQILHGKDQGQTPFETWCAEAMDPNEPTIDVVSRVGEAVGEIKVGGTDD